MEYPATTEAQERTLLDWIAFGFERYAERLGPDEGHKVRRYGLEFGRILRKNVDESDLDLPQLRKDLLGLIDQNCPAGDVVEVMVRCTSDLRVSSHGVQCSDITDQDLSSFKLCSSQAAGAILQLRRSALVPESVALFSDAIPRTVEARERAIHHLTNLSKCSGAITKRLSHSGTPDFPGASWLNAFLKVWDLCFFYLLLRVFHRGYPTLSRLLRVMRRVCAICDGDSEFLREFNCKCIAPASVGRGRKPKVHDPLSNYALQRRMNRFFHVDPNMTEGLKKCVQFYYSDECMRRVKGTETLMDFCDKVWERLQRGLKRRARKNAQSARSSAPRATLIGPELAISIPATSDLKVRAKNGASVHRIHEAAETRLFRVTNGRTSP